MKLLAVMAAIRLDEKPDNIEKVLFSTLMDGIVSVSSSQDRRIGASADPLASSTWEEVPFNGFWFICIRFLSSNWFLIKD